MSKNVVFLINKSEITAGTRGASLGPEAVISVARNKGKTIFSDYPIEEIKDVNDLLDRPTNHQFAKRIEGLLSIYNALNDKVSSLLSNNKFPFILAADHGSAGGTVAGIKTAFPTKKLGIVWIDAHADIHTPYTTPSGNMHGMPLATVLNEDNLPCKSNELSEETTKYWNELKQIGSIVPKAIASDLVYIAVRDTEEQEDAIIERLNIKNHSVAELRSIGVSTMMQEIETKLIDCDIIYVSFDVDSIDSRISMGTGTPVPNGLTVEEAKTLCATLGKSPKICCWEIAEVNPTLDTENRMAESAFEILEATAMAILEG